MLKPSTVAAVGLILMSLLVGCGGGPASVNISSRINAITPPKLTGISPASGPTTGGTTVAITGTDFQKGATVVFGDVPAAKINSVTSTSIEAVTPVHDPGKVDVTVTNPDTGSDTLLGAFTFEGGAPPIGGPAPTISSALPNSGPVLGGTVVTITGTDFQSGATVTFGQSSATGVVFSSATQLLATTPAHAAGIVDAIVRNPDGQSATVSSGFTYQPVPAPTISGISPSLGTTAGGTLVTITGTGFQPGVLGTTVTFGGVAATGVTVVSSTQINAIAPTHVEGAVDVTVSNPDGQSATGSSGFTYQPVPAPAISGISPRLGTTAGGTPVTITGTGFQAGATVTLGGDAATGVNVLSTTQIQAVTPAHAAGTVDVTGQNPDGQSATLASGFSYFVTPPTISNISPSSGPPAGGTVVTITGTNFQPGATVTFGGVLATAVTVVNATQITATTPAHAEGIVDVIVRNPDGQSATVSSGFTYEPVPAPTISGLLPTSGPEVGGTLVTITGTNFLAGATVSFGGVAAASVTVASATQIGAVTPPHATGAVDVRVTNPDAQFATLVGGFTHETPPPTITGISPSSGTTAGGTPVTITGTGFQAGATVTLGGDAATGVNVLSATQIQAVTPAHAVETVDVTGQNPDGQSATLASGFSYFVTPPTISNISPSSGPPAGGTVVTITGTNFQPGATVTFGGVPATALTVVNATQINATTPAHAAGPVDVKVANPDGGSATVTSGFTYGAVSIGCGADCGNVGDPYEGASPPASPIPVSDCGTLSPSGSPTYYQLSANIGSDPTSACITVDFPSGSFWLDLNGYTITGSLEIETNQWGDRIFNGTVTCNYGASAAHDACINVSPGGTIGSSTVKLDHLTVNQSYQGASQIRVSVNSSSPGSIPRPVIIEHTEGSSPSDPTSGRNNAMFVDGAGIAGVEFYNNIFAPRPDQAAAQGLVAYHAPSSWFHNNLANIPHPTFDTGLYATARPFLMDSEGKGSFAANSIAEYNTVYADESRVRVRSETGNIIRYNAFYNCRQAGSTGGCVHVGDTDLAAETSSAEVYGNTFELRDGRAIYLGGSSQITANVHNNTVTCFLGDCSSADWFVLADISTPDFAPGTLGPVLTVKHNDVSVLTGAGKNSVGVCTGAGGALPCTNTDMGPASGLHCDTGTVVGNSVQQCP